MVGTVPCTIITSRIRGSSRTRITTGIEIIPAKAQLPLRHHEVTAVLPGHPLQPAYKVKANHLPALHEDHTAHQAHRNRIVHRPDRHTVVLRIAGPLIAAHPVRTVALQEVTAVHQEDTKMNYIRPMAPQMPWFIFCGYSFSPGQKPGVSFCRNNHYIVITFYSSLKPTT